eukprot:scaffold73191_cov68-Phaeocystis_antarctica.AAC.3
MATEPNPSVVASVGHDKQVASELRGPPLAAAIKPVRQRLFGRRADSTHGALHTHLLGGAISGSEGQPQSKLAQMRHLNSDQVCAWEVGGDREGVKRATALVNQQGLKAANEVMLSGQSIDVARSEGSVGDLAQHHLSMGASGITVAHALAGWSAPDRGASDGGRAHVELHEYQERLVALRGDTEVEQRFVGRGKALREPAGVGHQLEAACLLCGSYVALQWKRQPKGHGRSLDGPRRRRGVGAVHANLKVERVHRVGRVCLGEAQYLLQDEATESGLGGHPRRDAVVDAWVDAIRCERCGCRCRRWKGLASARAVNGRHVGRR